MHVKVVDEIQEEDKNDKIVLSIVKSDEAEFNGTLDESHLLNLPFDVLMVIMEFSVGVEYMKFRASCKLCHLAAPIIQWNNHTASKRLQLVSPWLMVIGKDTITFIDPMFGDKYFIKMPRELELIDELKIHCSRYGWLLMRKCDDGPLILFNPLTGDTRKLPKDPYLESFGFSAPPTSPGCMNISMYGSENTRDGEQDIFSEIAFWEDSVLFSRNMQVSNIKPLTSLDEGLYALACEEDVRCLATLVRNFKLIEVYIEHGVTVLDPYLRAPRFRATLEDITDEPGSIAVNRTEKILLLTWHKSSETTKEPVCDSVTPSSLPQHDSSTPCKDSVCESITPRCMPDCILTLSTDESVITNSTVMESTRSNVSSSYRMIEIRQLSFDETKLDGEAGFADVAGSGVDSSGLSHDESFGVDGLDMNLNKPANLNISQVKTQSELPVSQKPDVCPTQEPILTEVSTQEPIVAEVSTEVPIVEEVGTQEFSVEDVVIEDYVRIDTAYETKYDVQSSKDAGTDDDDDLDEDFLVDEENEIYSFYTGQKFTTPKEAKDIVYLHSIESRRNLKLYKNDGVRIRAGCEGKVLVFTIDYVVELQSTNPNTTVKITVERNTDLSLHTRVFQRIYVCLGALKLGFKACKRDMLGLDCAFMKGPFPGQVLVAVGLDSNNGIYPLAYALVEAETKRSWGWFLQCLGDDIDLHPNSNFTVISDRQRCGQAYKDLLWRAASATNVRDFEKYMLELKTMNPKAHENTRHNKTTCKGQGQKETTGGNNTEASGSASGQAQQTEPVVGQDGSGGSIAGVVIGLSAAAGERGAGVAS
ncbi:ribonuclease H-like domain-containing protein [Tanacetum coccineum]